MARYEDEYGEYFVDEPTPDIETVLWNEGTADGRATELFEAAFFDNNDQAYQDLIDYLWDVYGIDFEDVFDWEDFRSWYDAA